MNLNSSKKYKNSFKARIAQEIDEGLAASQDPDNAGLPDLSARITTMYSAWYNRICPECKFKFREGDRVRLCPQCDQAYHDDGSYNLRCWQKHFCSGSVCRKDRFDPIAEVHRKGCNYQWNDTFPDENSQINQKNPFPRRIEQAASQFMIGLKNIWKPFGQETIVIVKEDDEMVGLKCPWCRFFIRAGDQIVKCPCGKCNTWFHMDIYRHLTCWNEWNGARGHDFCPTTCARIEGRRR